LLKGELLKEGKVARKKKKKTKFNPLQSLLILVFVLIGFVIGGAIGWFYYNKLFDTYLAAMHKYIEQDWSKVEYYSNRATDQVIILKKMLVKDKVKFSRAMVNDVIDARAKVIGADSLEEKNEVLVELEKALNEVMIFYNKRMDLRNKRFGYIEWGMITIPYIEHYNDHKNNYIDAVADFNNKISRRFFKSAAKRKGYGPLPVAKQSYITAVKINTEKYQKDDIYRMDKLEDSSSAGSY